MWSKRRLDLVQALLMLLIAGAVLRFGVNTLFGVHEPSSDASTAELLTHDGSANHGFQVFLCIDPSDLFVDGTVTVAQAGSYTNLALPARPTPETSLGFLDNAVALTNLLGSPAPQKLRDQTPHCLKNDQVAHQAAQAVQAAVSFTGKSGVIFSKDSKGSLSDVPKAVISAESRGFPYWTAPSSTPIPLSFRWDSGIQQRSWSERFLRLDFSTILDDKTLGQVELPTDVWVYFPANMTPINSPTSAVYSSGRDGVHALDVHVQPNDTAVEVDWVDEQAANQRDYLVLLLGVAMGVIGGIVSTLAFGSPRWDDWIRDALWPPNGVRNGWE
jgi:hypothetical protein